MKVYVATLVDLENTVVVGVYTSQDTAIGKLEKALDQLEYMDNYEVYPEVVVKYIDDMDEDKYV